MLLSLIDSDFSPLSFDHSLGRQIIPSGASGLLGSDPRRGWLKMLLGDCVGDGIGAPVERERWWWCWFRFTSRRLNPISLLFWSSRACCKSASCSSFLLHNIYWVSYAILAPKSVKTKFKRIRWRKLFVYQIGAFWMGEAGYQVGCRKCP